MKEEEVAHEPFREPWPAAGADEHYGLLVRAAAVVPVVSLVLTLLYTPVLLWIRWLDPQIVLDWSAFLAPLADLVGTYAPFVERFRVQVTAFGYEDWALVGRHAIALTWLFGTIAVASSPFSSSPLFLRLKESFVSSKAMRLTKVGFLLVMSCLVIILFAIHQFDDVTHIWLAKPTPGPLETLLLAFSGLTFVVVTIFIGLIGAGISRIMDFGSPSRPTSSTRPRYG